jgi:hypothetical protein
MQFKTDEEAVTMINQAPYGLGGSVFCGDIDRAERMTAAIRTGMANINDFAVNYLCQSLPFGGRGISGFGRFAGIEGLRDECILKAVTTDKLAWMKTTIPSILDYPIQKQKSIGFCEGLAEVMYAGSISDKARGLGKLIKASMQ